jgi:pimeloyl-ACP methyl ester carboxylesterase
MAGDTVAFLDSLKIGRSQLVGHSDGANVALLVALARPDLVDRLVLISGNFHHDGLVAELDLNELRASFAITATRRVAVVSQPHGLVWSAALMTSRPWRSLSGGS